MFYGFGLSIDALEFCIVHIDVIMYIFTHVCVLNSLILYGCPCALQSAHITAFSFFFLGQPQRFGISLIIKKENNFNDLCVAC